MSKLFQNYLIVSDLDGTFFGPKATILENNLEAIHYFQENGGVFTIATGRDYPILKQVLPNAKEFITGPAILCNGAYLYDFKNSTVHDEISLDKEKFLPLLNQILDRFPETGFRISTHFGYLCPRVSQYMEENISIHSPIYKHEQLENHMDSPWLKCVFTDYKENIDEIGKYVLSLNNPHFNTLPSFPTLYEILPPNAGKGRKIQKLREFYPGRTVVCVGDYANDVEMLETADVAACPENAINEVKAISTIHLCHHEKGCIADLIYRLDQNPATMINFSEEKNGKSKKG